MKYTHRRHLGRPLHPNPGEGTQQSFIRGGLRPEVRSDRKWCFFFFLFLYTPSKALLPTLKSPTEVFTELVHQGI